MSVNGITGSYASMAYQQTQTSSVSAKVEVGNTNEEIGVVYEKSAEASAYTVDVDTVSRLQNELQFKQQQFAGLVEKLLGKQGKKSNDLMNLLTGLRNGTVQVDKATQLQAQKEIGENGYWGVEQTSNRLVEMAKALSGGDPDKADELIAAMEKGFEQATRAFGDDLPQICRDTVDAATEKIHAWRDSFSSTVTIDKPTQEVTGTKPIKE